jgi:hypothetical protein
MVRAAPLLITLVLAAGCTSQTQVREEELLQLLQWLPGEYNNSSQAQSDVQRGVRPPHEALALSIVSVDDPVIGSHVYYVQEAAADNPSRVMVQRVWTLEVTDKAIVQRVWTLSEPLRWRDAHRNPDVLRSMMNQDVSVTRGCEINWKKMGARFVGTNDPKRCRSSSRATSGTVQVETRMELDATELALAETARDAQGQLVQGRTDEPSYRFHKQAP